MRDPKVGWTYRYGKYYHPRHGMHTVRPVPVRFGVWMLRAPTTTSFYYDRPAPPTQAHPVTASQEQYIRFAANALLGMA